MPQNLSAEWYVDESVYKREREKIFALNWWLFAPAVLVSKPGQYVCDNICGWPVFVLRSNDRKLRAFMNICRHRGASLLPQGCGENIESIRCPYHGWLYDDKGCLLKAPHFSDSSSCLSDSIALIELDLRVWNDLIFIKVAKEQGLGLDDWLGEVSTLCKDFPSPSDLVYSGEFSVSGELNWKAYCDNTVEGYHLNLVHPRLGRTLANGCAKLRSVNDGHSVVFDVSYGSDSEGLRGKKGMWIYHFPGFQLVLGERAFKAERVNAVGPNHVSSKNWAWHRDSAGKEKQDNFEWARQIVEEDFAICMDVTSNMRSGAYVPGPLSPKMEQHVIRLQEIIQEALLRD